MKAIRYYVRPECGRDDRWGPTLGPFADFLQITYGDLRVGPNGAMIAQKAKGFDTDWYFDETWYGPDDTSTEEQLLPMNFVDSFGCDPAKWFELGWSDLVIWAEVDE